MIFYIASAIVSIGGREGACTLGCGIHGRPSIRSNGAGKGEASQLASECNTALTSQLATISGISLHVIDAYQLIDNAVANPAAYVRVWTTRLAMSSPQPAGYRLIDPDQGTVAPSVLLI